MISEYFDTKKLKKHKIYPLNINVINNGIFVFLENSYLLKFTIEGKLIEIVKFKNSIQSLPVFVKNFLFFIDKKK